MGKIKKLLIAGALSILAAGAISFGNNYHIRSLARDSAECVANAPKIKNKTELLEKLNNYREKFEISQDEKIQVELYDYNSDEEFRKKFNLGGINYSPFLNEIMRLGYHNYLIKILAEDANDCSLIHELGHIKGNHLEKLASIKNPIYKYLVEWYVVEPEAVSFANKRENYQ
jgi:hypothetical protein